MNSLFLQPQSKARMFISVILQKFYFVVGKMAKQYLKYFMEEKKVEKSFLGRFHHNTSADIKPVKA